MEFVRLAGFVIRGLNKDVQVRDFAMTLWSWMWIVSLVALGVGHRYFIGFFFGMTTEDSSGAAVNSVVPCFVNQRSIRSYFTVRCLSAFVISIVLFHYVRLRISIPLLIELDCSCLG